MWTKNTMSGVTEKITILAISPPSTNMMVAHLEPIRSSSQPAKRPAMTATTLLARPSTTSILALQCRMPAANTPVKSIRAMKPSLKVIREIRKTPRFL